MTTAQEQKAIDGFRGVQNVVANSEKFKIKLGIGRDAYTSLKVSKAVAQLWDLGGAAGTGAGIATSGTVASTFFGTFWSSVGLATAVTPVGWIVGAALVSGGAYYGVARLFKSYSGSRVEEIPKFLNTGLDVLATSAFDLMGSLALKVAAIDGNVDPAERSAIKEYFVEEWGYDQDYMDHAMAVLEDNIHRSRLDEMTSELALFAMKNSDCNFEAIQTEIKKLLIEIAEADGHLDEREEMAIERIHKSFAEHGGLLISAGKIVSRSAKSISDLAAGSATGIQSALTGISGKLWTRK